MAQPTTHQSLEETSEAKDLFGAALPTTVAKFSPKSPTAMVLAFGATGVLATEVVSTALDSTQVMDMAYTTQDTATALTSVALEELLLQAVVRGHCPPA